MPFGTRGTNYPAGIGGSGVDPWIPTTTVEA